MVKNFFCCVSLKNGAGIMIASNLMFATTALFGASIGLYREQKKEDELYLIIAVIIGLYNFVVAGTMIAALLKGNERYVLLYILLEFINLFIIATFAGINIFVYWSFWIAVLFVLCLILFYGLFCMYGFYTELAEYNSVKSGVVEITCNMPVNPVMFPEKSVESTPV